ncbi:MaoC/PaaZ C-terminal domain-containing protein [Nocardia grenadensis]|uniref:MaoC/PaaZ C-terminal domain-containing protein n=1 Tax=Nocardia grenadensis TaxID=931537 RepID=UPI0007A3A6CD|nr:MaoC/PaaZ C-terminal domain-containing protein [Nocardia grenadensis]
MPIDVPTATGLVIPGQEFRWDEADARRYRHAIGQHDRQSGVLPTFAMTAPGAFGIASPDFYHQQPPEIRFPGIRLRLATLLQQEQELRVHARIPESGVAWCHSRVLEIADRGSAAVLVQRTELIGADGVPLVSGVSRIHARGEGTGTGRGTGGSSPAPPAPDRAADVEIVVRTDDQQAVWYQRSGKNNSMRGNVHTDAEFARAAGLDGPILQGVCTYAMVCAALVDTVLDAEIARLHTYTGRFTGIVFPGESLRTRVWTGNRVHHYHTTVPERGDKSVLVGDLRTD